MIHTTYLAFTRIMNDNKIFSYNICLIRFFHYHTKLYEYKYNKKCFSKLRFEKSFLRIFFHGFSLISIFFCYYCFK